MDALGITDGRAIAVEDSAILEPDLGLAGFVGVLVEIGQAGPKCLRINQLIIDRCQGDLARSGRNNRFWNPPYLAKAPVDMQPFARS